MKPVPILTALCLLSACGTPSVSTPSADQVPPSLTIPCDSPRWVPERDMSRAEAVPIWLADRQALVECGSRHGALVSAITPAL